MEVEFFESHEAAARRLREAMEAADARVARWQAALCAGECFLSVVEGGLVVFGEVLEGYSEPHLRHYRFCRCFSVACPEGELGDVHVSTVACRISRQFFEEMRQAGWAMDGPAPTSARCDSGETNRGEGEAPPPRAVTDAEQLAATRWCLEAGDDRMETGMRTPLLRGDAQTDGKHNASCRVAAA